MFNFFRKKNNEVYLANNANIETVYENGKVVTFMITLNEEHHKIEELFKSKKLVSGFVNKIEERIKNNEYLDYPSQMLNDLYGNSNKQDLSKIERTVITTDFKPIMRW